MKKIISAALAAIMLAALLGGCGTDEAPTPSQPTTTQAQPTTLPTTTEAGTTAPEEEPLPLPLEYQQGSDEFNVESGGVLLVSVASVGVPQVEALPAVGEYYQRKESDIKEHALFLEAQAQQQYDQAKGLGGVFLPYSLEVGYEVMRNDGVLFTVMRRITSYTGGAHEGEEVYAENFVAAGGQLLTLGDLFSVPREEYLPRIRQEVLRQIADSGREGEYFPDYKDSMMEIFDPQSFCVTDSGVIFFWQTYQLAAYMGGPQLFEIPFASLGDILDSRWLPPGAATVSSKRVEETIEYPQGGPIIQVKLAVPQADEIAGASSYFAQKLDGLLEFIDKERIALEAQLLADGQKQLDPPYSFDLGFEVKRNDRAVFSVMRRIVAYTGGAHEGETWYAESFDPRTGALLTLDDLFAVPADQYLPAIAAWAAGQADADTGAGIDTGKMESSFDPKNFCITADGVIFFWQVYDIAAYAAGPQFFHVSFDDMKGLVQEKWTSQP